MQTIFLLGLVYEPKTRFDLAVWYPGLTISFSGEIPVIGGNGIPFRNFGEFRWISNEIVEFWILKRNISKNTEISDPGN